MPVHFGAITPSFTREPIKNKRGKLIGYTRQAEGRLTITNDAGQPEDYYCFAYYKKPDARKGKKGRDEDYFHVLAAATQNGDNSFIKLYLGKKGRHLSWHTKARDLSDAEQRQLLQDAKEIKREFFDKTPNAGSN